MVFVFPVVSGESASPGAGETSRPAEESFVNFTWEELGHFAVVVMETFWRLYAAQPANHLIAPICSPGMRLSVC